MGEWNLKLLGDESCYMLCTAVMNMSLSGSVVYNLTEAENWCQKNDGKSLRLMLKNTWKTLEKCTPFLLVALTPLKNSSIFDVSNL